MPILFMIVIGAAAGLFATRIMRVEAGLLPTVAIGILGALIGGLVLRVILTLTGMAFGFVGAVLGAMVLIYLWRVYGPRDY